jgi:hypothetical protein
MSSDGKTKHSDQPLHRQAFHLYRKVNLKTDPKEFCQVRSITFTCQADVLYIAILKTDRLTFLSSNILVLWRIFMVGIFIDASTQIYIPALFIPFYL